MAKLLRKIIPLEPRLAKKVLAPLRQVSRATTAKSLNFECVRTTTTALGYIDLQNLKSDDIKSVKEMWFLSLETLSDFVKSKDQNLVYLGLVGLIQLLSLKPKLSDVLDENPSSESDLEVKNLFLRCLSDKDLSIRLKALDLVKILYLKTNSSGTSSNSVRSLVETLLKYLQLDFSSLNIDLDTLHVKVVETVISVCTHDNYGGLTGSVKWFVQKVLYVLLTAYTFTMQNESVVEIVSRELVDICFKVEATRALACELGIVLIDQMDEALTALPTYQADHLTLSMRDQLKRFEASFSLVLFIISEFDESPKDLDSILESVLLKKFCEYLFIDPDPLENQNETFGKPLLLTFVPSMCKLAMVQSISRQKIEIIFRTLLRKASNMNCVSQSLWLRRGLGYLSEKSLGEKPIKLDLIDPSYQKEIPFPVFDAEVMKEVERLTTVDSALVEEKNGRTSRLVICFTGSESRFQSPQSYNKGPEDATQKNTYSSVDASYDHYQESSKPKTNENIDKSLFYLPKAHTKHVSKNGRGHKISKKSFMKDEQDLLSFGTDESLAKPTENISANGNELCAEKGSDIEDDETSFEIKLPKKPVQNRSSTETYGMSLNAPSALGTTLKNIAVDFDLALAPPLASTSKPDHKDKDVALLEAKGINEGTVDESNQVIQPKKHKKKHKKDKKSKEASKK